ncbi:methyltransferase domain-containing protein [Sphingobium sp. Sx8-8]|uniref:methyltransferase domain-containing protein n=1 Tax=Sphingobium sp. Sx8-8 TaxID=2933617 RepID=UPI001F57EEBB|nr:methyltransferase domain-containing protein [Sphingobium sp. Sx8-8]
MDALALSLLACPACGGRLDGALRCRACGTAYRRTDGITDLRLPGDARTERVREFYAAAPFPGYPARDSIEWLRTRAERSPFARLLDAAIPYDARILEMGCGTGQMSLYLARGERIVIAADLCRPSLALGRAAATRLGIGQVEFVETDVHHPGLREGAFDIVYCSGMLHHTPNPYAAFVRVARLVRPGGLIVIGLYNRYARLPHRLRRVAAFLTGGRWVRADRVLASRRAQPERYRAWLNDQYHHPEEHSHTLAQLRRWFAANDIAYIRAVPGALLDQTDGAGLTDAEEDGWWLEDILAQIGWIGRIGWEGGLFATVGRAKRSACMTGEDDRIASPEHA